MGERPRARATPTPAPRRGGGRGDRARRDWRGRRRARASASRTRCRRAGRRAGQGCRRDGRGRGAVRARPRRCAARCGEGVAFDLVRACARGAGPGRPAGARAPGARAPQAAPRARTSPRAHRLHPRHRLAERAGEAAGGAGSDGVRGPDRGRAGGRHRRRAGAARASRRRRRLLGGAARGARLGPPGGRLLRRRAGDARDDPRVRANRLRLLVDATGLLRRWATSPRSRDDGREPATQPIEIHLCRDSTGDTAGARRPRCAGAVPDSLDGDRAPPARDDAGRARAGLRAHHGAARRGGLLHAHRSRAASPARTELCRARRSPLRPARAAARRAAGRPRATRPSCRRAGRWRWRRTTSSASAAMEFAVKHDDGLAGEGLGEAEIVLIGVSRTGKTPLSMFLGYLGYKTANVPLVRGIEPPDALFRIDRAKIVGLTIDPERLARIRGRRLRAIGSRGRDGYADLNKIYEELEEAAAVQRRLGVRDRRHEPRGRGGGRSASSAWSRSAGGRSVRPGAAALVALLAALALRGLRRRGRRRRRRAPTPASERAARPMSRPRGPAEDRRRAETSASRREGTTMDTSMRRLAHGRDLPRPEREGHARAPAGGRRPARAAARAGAPAGRPDARGARRRATHGHPAGRAIARHRGRGHGHRHGRPLGRSSAPSARTSRRSSRSASSCTPSCTRRGRRVSVVVRMDGEPLTALAGVPVDGPQTVAQRRGRHAAGARAVAAAGRPGRRCPQRVNGTSNTFEASSLLGFAASSRRAAGRRRPRSSPRRAAPAPAAPSTSPCRAPIRRRAARRTSCPGSARPRTARRRPWSTSRCASRSPRPLGRGSARRSGNMLLRTWTTRTIVRGPTTHSATLPAGRCQLL